MAVVNAPRPKRDRSGVDPAFLGVGFKFPFQVDRQGRLARAAGEQRIEESIGIVLGTRLGERVMRPEFGCQAHELLFAPNNASTRSAIVQTVRQALVRYEPRIDVLEVSAEGPEPTVVLVKIRYRVRANNSIANMVYPFYLTEGR